MKNLIAIVYFLSPFIGFAQATPFQMVERMGRGINLGNTLSAPYEGNWADPVEESYFENVAIAGFETVRIPIRFDTQTTPFDEVTYEDGGGNYIGSPDDYLVNESYLDRIEEVTDWALNHGLVAIIDVHGDHWFWESYDEESDYYRIGNDRLAAEDRFRAIWRDISERFQNKSEDLLFEIMNEAYFSMNADEVNFINQEILDIIRLTNPTRNVIVNGGGVNSWEAPLQLPTDFLASDDYLIPTFHYYKPFAFTSSSKENWNDFDWGTEADMANIDNHFDQVMNWAATNNVPVFLGEFGADNVEGYNYYNGTYSPYGGPDNASRVLYHEYVAEAAISRGFSFTAWDAGEKANKSIYLVSSQTWVEDVKEALLGENSEACETSGIITNADVECGYDTGWDLFVQGVSEATNENATSANSYYGLTMQVDVASASGAWNSVMLRNLEVDASTYGDTTLRFSCFAKGSVEDQAFRIRLKVVEGTGTSYLFGSINTLSSTFEYFESDFEIPSAVTALQLQVLCGRDQGTYYFDDFSMTDLSSLSVAELQMTDEYKIYPNPTSSNYVHISGKHLEHVENMDLVSVTGQVFPLSFNGNLVTLPNVNRGLYFIRMRTKQGDTQIKKLIINQ
ncbi:cellulase family glycosylhydrolase [Mangrovimonas futianensis]|uniref:cellulase family glycosylhydrolase n=1 Tax=Mangrovimonas futianensis TaxID=2895523 RepID=UPI001E442E7C|nr:cellulase family glycosylhydrolase [Mangrovimonas futianensis]